MIHYKDEGFLLIHIKLNVYKSHIEDECKKESRRRRRKRERERRQE